MKIYYIIFLIIFSITIFFPTAFAQIPNQDSNQKSIQVTISLKGEMHVKHIIEDLDESSPINLIDGIISNLTVKNQEGSDIPFGPIESNDSIMILPSNKETVVEYDLEDELILKDNVWTLDFLYLESTSFIFPPEVDLIFVNNQPAYLGEKNGILCHGCQMILEYSLNEPKILEKIKTQEREFLFEIRTWAKINQFSFNPTLKGISFGAIGEDRFVTIIVPFDFLVGPYQAYLDGEKIFFHEYINNGTHVWLNFRPQVSGEVSITGTVVPEFGVDPESDFFLEYVIVGAIIVGIVIVGIFFFKRKK